MTVGLNGNSSYSLRKYAWSAVRSNFIRHPFTHRSLYLVRFSGARFLSPSNAVAKNKHINTQTHTRIRAGTHGRTLLRVWHLLNTQEELILRSILRSMLLRHLKQGVVGNFAQTWIFLALTVDLHTPSSHLSPKSLIKHDTLCRW